MSGEVVIHAEGICDVEKTIFVAVGKNVKEGKSIISWALKSFSWTRMCILHVHQPDHFSSPLDAKLSGTDLKQNMVKACQEVEHLRLHKLLNQYLLFISQAGIQEGKVWLEMNNVEKGIIHIIGQQKIRWLVMGAAAESHYSKQLSELKSSKAKFVCQHAPIHCQIWFPCSGCLIHTRYTDSWAKRSDAAFNIVFELGRYNFVLDVIEVMLEVYNSSALLWYVSNAGCLSTCFPRYRSGINVSRSF